MITQKLRFCRIVLFTALLLSFSNLCNSQTFDKKLQSIGKLYAAKKHEMLLKQISPLKASKELADLRLFLEAEALKGLGRKAEALSIYAKVLKLFPETESAFQSRFPHFLLMLETADESSTAKLEALGRTLPTSWQRGTAIEKMLDLPFLKDGRKSRIALASLREFASDSTFYRSVTASHRLLKNILQAPEKWNFEDDEWLEVLLMARKEKILNELFKAKGINERIMGRWGRPAFELFRAEAILQQQKTAQAIGIFDKIISEKKALPGIMAMAYQFRGDAHHFAEHHDAAAKDYRNALQFKSFPVDQTAALYRLMRSAFKLSKDAECLEIINRLVKGDDLGTLFPVHIYEMGLEHFDNGNKERSIPFFMTLARNFPGHYRADDALGYAIIAMGNKSSEAKTLIKLLKKKYPNSFFITWVAPELMNEKLPSAAYKTKKLSSEQKQRILAMKKLWKSEFSGFAKAEAIKLTNKYPANFELYRAIIDIARENNDYNQLTAYGERMARQLLESDQNLGMLPEWAWKAFYPKAYEKDVWGNAEKFKIDPFWILSIMREESHFNPETLSRSNAMGLMQILPNTGKWIAGKLGEKRFNKNKLWNTDVNIRYGSWYLKYLIDMFKNDMHLASASYNGGQGNVTRKVEQGPYASQPVLERLDKIPLPETRDYYKKVMGSYWSYKRLYNR